jgi:glutamate synthase (ferredoxin)
MTGGKVVVLGKTGRNFAAGMSGGIAYVYDKDKTFSKGLCNMEMVTLDPLTDNDKNDLKQLIESHQKYTESTLATKFLDNWNINVKHFIKVFPTDYKKALERLAKESNVEQLIA